MSLTCIGIDGGGTKTRALASLPNGRATESSAGPCTLAAMTAPEAHETICDVSDHMGVAPNTVGAICAAIAGWSFEKRRYELQSLLQTSFPNAKIALIPDFEAAFRDAQPDADGVHVIAGTGSVAYGENKLTRQAHRAGGYGYLIDDAGSGYGVGRAAIAASLRAIDGTGQATGLGNAIAEQLQLGPGSWENFIEAVYGGVASRVTIASLAQVVAAKSDAGDEVANHILFRAGGALAKLAEAVYRSVFREDSSRDVQPRPIAFSRSGSLWLAGRAITDVFERSVMRFAPACSVGAVADVDAAKGALAIAKEMI